MADFCAACSEEIFDKDFKELAGISTEQDTKEGRYAEVICEGCGFIQVDHAGVCVTKGCLRDGQPGHDGIPFSAPPQS